MIDVIQHEHLVHEQRRFCHHNPSILVQRLWVAATTRDDRQKRRHDPVRPYRLSEELLDEWPALQRLRVVADDLAEDLAFVHPVTQPWRDRQASE